MNKYEKSFFEFLKEYKNEPNAPDYDGEYPQPYELTIEDAELILNVKSKLDKEIERLNNIIDGIEKWLENNHELYLINHQTFSWGVLAQALDKLKELKEGKK